MPEALARVKTAYGPDAVILGTRWVKPTGLRGLTDAARVEITAAPPESAPATVAATSEVPAALRTQYERLTAAAVSDTLARRILARCAHGPDTREATTRRFRETVEKLVPTSGGIHLRTGQPTCVALLGSAGAGKTTTIAKLAAEFALRRKARVALVTLDLSGVGRHEQLARYAELIGARHDAPQTLEAVQALRPQLANMDLILVDTSGLGPNDHDRQQQLAELLDAMEPDERHLVLPASMDAGVQSRMAEFFAPLCPNRLLLTRVDEALGMGVVLNTADRLALSVSYLSSGQTVPHDLQVASATTIGAALCSPGEVAAVAFSDAVADSVTDEVILSTSA